MKKLMLLLLMTVLVALPLACADRNFDSPVSPVVPDSPNNGVVASPTP